MSAEFTVRRVFDGRAQTTRFDRPTFDRPDKGLRTAAARRRAIGTFLALFDEQTASQPSSKDSNMNFRALATTLGAVIAVGLAAPASAAYVLTVVPRALVGTVGEFITVDINLGLGTSESVDTAGFSLSYNPAVLSFSSGSAGLLNPDPPWFTDINEASSGLVNVSTLDFDLNGLVGELSGSLAELRFKLVGVGSSPLTLADVVMEFALGGSFQPDIINNSQIVVRQASVVPIPATAYLAGLGLALLAWSRRRAA